MKSEHGKYIRKSEKMNEHIEQRNRQIDYSYRVRFLQTVKNQKSIKMLG
jgi:hypothetical protein